MFTFQITFPLAASRHSKSPMAPSEYTLPSSKKGVARGPSPPSGSSNAAG
jgi:hypothetical protein